MMIEELNKELAEVQEKLRRKRKLDNMITQTRQTLDNEIERKCSLEKILQNENEDVERLESPSITGLFYSILGSKKQQLETERQEALAAKLKYDDCCNSVDTLERELKSYMTSLSQVSNAESQYQNVLKHKEEYILQSNSPSTQKLLKLIDEAATLESEKKELQEAIASGENTVGYLRRTVDSLNSAENWGTWDMMGGGFIATSAKHSHIDEAREYISQAKIALNRFQMELSDVKLTGDLEVEIGSFEKFADYFFDGLISDWIVQSKIQSSLESVNRVLREVNEVLLTLRTKSNSLFNELTSINDELKVVIEQA